MCNDLLVLRPVFGGLREHCLRLEKAFLDLMTCSSRIMSIELISSPTFHVIFPLFKASNPLSSLLRGVSNAILTLNTDLFLRQHSHILIIFLYFLNDQATWLIFGM
jgi:hypothetical protein